MKQGRTLQEVAAELTRQRESKRDFVVSAGAIEVTDDASLLMLHRAEDGARDERFGMTDLFHRQLGSTLGIPSKYYDKISEAERLKIPVRYFNVFGGEVTCYE